MNPLIKRLTFFLCIFCFSVAVFAQSTALVSGVIRDDRGKPLELVNVAVMGTPGGTASDNRGHYQISVPAGKQIILAFSMLSYATVFDTLNLNAGVTYERDVVLTDRAINLAVTNITARFDQAGGIIRMNPKTSELLPSYGGIETLVKLLGLGISSGNELSSTYSVRGGNFDENLVYANDFEIYRPFLVRSGQQEGLSFLNSSLVNSVSFSSGGFEARYGDKLSSVLDVQYKRPDSLRGDVQMSLLGAAFHIEGTSKHNLMSFLSGFRYKSSQYVLNAMETKGEYKPSFLDWQNYITWRINETLELSALGYFSSNRYNLVPETRETSYGTINQAMRLTIYFDGQEADRFTTFLGGFRLQHNPRKELLLKYIVSGYSSLEDETYDIQGQYWIGLLDTDLGSDQYGEVAENLGVGTFIDHARNYLDVQMLSAEHKGLWEKAAWYLQWGAKVQKEIINDKIWQWNYIDSSGFSLPHVSDSVGYTDPSQQPYQQLEISDVIISQLSLNSMRYSGFLQGGWEWQRDSVRYNAIGGVRASYWDVNQQLVVSPRVALGITPDWKRKYSFRLATGFYQQPPFYRELRDMQGVLHTDVKAQKSIHFVAGFEHTDSLWQRPFRVVGELYYKKLSNMIPYVVDNVRIRYLPDLKSNGYAVGLDFKMNGQFVPDAESWVSVSIMQTREDIEDDYYYEYYDADGNIVASTDITVADSARFEPGYIPRPADQRVNVSLFFQDYLPKNPTYKMHLSLVFGTGLPFGPPDSDKYKHTLRMPPYRRVDIGFSKQLAGHATRKDKVEDRRSFRFVRNAWISLEVFNLLNINNTVSYIWVTDVEANRYAVPNYLTKRQLNLKLLVDF